MAGGERLQVPPRTLLVLCGPAGSGKSTFAAQRFKSTVIVSSDYCRALICDDENNQQVTADAFSLFYFILHKRMFLNRFSVADSTALQADARRKLLEAASQHNYFTVLLIFNVSATTCLERDQRRVRKVGEQVIAYHTKLLQQTLLVAPNEGWNRVYVLEEETSHDGVEIEIM